MPTKAHISLQDSCKSFVHIPFPVNNWKCWLSIVRIYSEWGFLNRRRGTKVHGLKIMEIRYPLRWDSIVLQHVFRFHCTASNFNLQYWTLFSLSCFFFTPLKCSNIISFHFCKQYKNIFSWYIWIKAHLQQGIFCMDTFESNEPTEQAHHFWAYNSWYFVELGKIFPWICQFGTTTHNLWVTNCANF